MEKIWVPLVGGIIIGAAAVEILHRVPAKKLKGLPARMSCGVAKLCGRAVRATADARRSFVNGFRSVLKEKKAAAAAEAGA